MTVGGASGSPAVFQGETADRGRGWGIDPLPEVSRRHTAPRRRNRQGRYLQNPWRGGIPVAGQMHLGVTHGGRKGRGRGIDPFPDVSAAAIPPCVEGIGRERYLQNPWRGGIPVAWQMHLGVTHGGCKGRGGALAPYPRFPAAAMPPRVGGIGRERYLQNPWRGGITVAWQMHLGVTHGGRKGQGRGIGLLTWASRHRRGGLPIRSSEGDRPHMGQGGI